MKCNFAIYPFNALTLLFGWKMGIQPARKILHYCTINPWRFFLRRPLGDPF